MFLRRLHQTRHGRTYTYYALVETVRSPSGVVRQRTICYLGRLDNLRPTDWLRSAERRPDPAWIPRLQGVYLLRTTDNTLSADDVWRTYMLLTRVEAAFGNLKTDLSIRPIFHHKEKRGDAHMLFSVLAYALAVTLQLRHRQHRGQLTTAVLLETLRPLGLAELSYRTSDGHRLAFERAAVPSAEQQTILDSLGWPIAERYLPPNLEAEPRRVV